MTKKKVNKLNNLILVLLAISLGFDALIRIPIQLLVKIDIADNINLLILYPFKYGLLIFLIYKALFYEKSEQLSNRVKWYYRIPVIILSLNLLFPPTLLINGVICLVLSIFYGFNKFNSNQLSQTLSVINIGLQAIVLIVSLLSNLI